LAAAGVATPRVHAAARAISAALAYLFMVIPR
jgi:hypothetical protein